MNRLTSEAKRLDGETATDVLLLDCYGDAIDPVVKGTRLKAYRKQYGILFPEQIDSIANVEFTVERVDVMPKGIFWRSHPQGRKLNDRGDGNSKPYYKR